jgi:hypothetical protein
MNENILNFWYRSIEVIFKLPGAKVDREKFLRQVLTKGGATQDQVNNAIETTPAKAGISKLLIEDISNRAIRSHKIKVTLASVAAGLPGGLLGIGAIPADFVQFYWHVIVLIQKLAYLHGWPDLMEEEIDRDLISKFTLFIGVMLGMGSAKKGVAIMTEIYTKSALSTAKRFLDSSIAKIIEQILLRLGINIGRERISKTIGIAIPVVGGAIFGITTCNAFGTMGVNLREHLSKLPFAVSME